MINNKYLCDYTINIPIFTDDPTNKNICQYLLKEHRNIIIYCNSQKEGKNMNELLNKLQNKSSEYIDCNTSKLKRKTIIDNFKSGELPFLVNVKILVEGFDAPITKGVCFMHLPSSKTTLIQIIGRSLRLHKDKTFAKIILPFSSKEDESSIVNFMKVMAKNDTRIKKSFESKKVGGYISIENIHEDAIEANNEETNDINFKYDLIFDSMGVMNNNYNQEIWEKRLEELKTYIDENGKRPSIRDKNKNIKKLSDWAYTQVSSYKHKIKIMSNPDVYSKWKSFTSDNKYKNYFISFNESWKLHLIELKKFINDNNKMPTVSSNKFLSKWLGYQKSLYIKKEHIMLNENIYDIWTTFINEYKKYFISDEEEWIIKLNELKQYIDIKYKTPTRIENKKIYVWTQYQKYNYKRKLQNMSQEKYYNLWNEFITSDTYKKYFIPKSYISEWKHKLEKVKQYVDNNNKRLSNRDKNNEIKQLAKWVETQQKNFTRKEQLMTNNEIYELWRELLNDDKYKKFFVLKEKIREYKWKEILDKVKIYIDENKIRPSSKNKNNDIKKLGLWIIYQQSIYNKKLEIMTYLSVYKEWETFINHDKYKKYFN